MRNPANLALYQVLQASGQLTANTSQRGNIMQRYYAYAKTSQTNLLNKEVEIILVLSSFRAC